MRGRRASAVGYALGVAVLGAVFRSQVPDDAVGGQTTWYAAGLDTACATAGILALTGAIAVLLNREPTTARKGWRPGLDRRTQAERPCRWAGPFGVRISR